MSQDKTLIAQERGQLRVLPAYSLHLDLVRGLAALMVFAGHLRLIVTGHTGAVDGPGGEQIMFHPASATGLGHSSVIVFFVLSGYLVGGTTLRDLNREAFSWSLYVTRRLSRLWTVLVPALLIGGTLDYGAWRFFSGTSVFSSGAFTSTVHGFPQLLDFLNYLFFLQFIDRMAIGPYGTNVALWSLSAEFWYYVMFPLFAVGLLSISRSKPVRVCLILVAGVLMWLVGKSIAQYFPLWLCGVAAYLAPARIPAKFQKAAILVLTGQFCFVLSFFRAHAANALAADAVIAASFTFLLYALLHRKSPAKTSLYSRFAHGISFPSYTLYATHIPACILLAALFEAEMPGLFRHTFAASALIAVLVLLYAAAMYYMFERRTDRIRRSFEAIFIRRGSIAADSIGAVPIRYAHLRE